MRNLAMFILIVAVVSLTGCASGPKPILTSYRTTILDCAVETRQQCREQTIYNNGKTEKLKWYFRVYKEENALESYRIVPFAMHYSQDLGQLLKVEQSAAEVKINLQNRDWQILTPEGWKTKTLTSEENLKYAKFGAANYKNFYERTRKFIKNGGKPSEEEMEEWYAWGRSIIAAFATFRPNELYLAPWKDLKRRMYYDLQSRYQDFVVPDVWEKTSSDDPLSWGDAKWWNHEMSDKPVPTVTTTNDEEVF